MSTSLPRQSKSADSDIIVRDFFDRYYTAKIEYPANEVDAVLNFFTKRGFADDSATTTATIILQQAKLDSVPVFKLLDTLEGLTDVKLSALVSEILNYSRTKTSSLGYKIQNKTTFIEARNIDSINNLEGLVNLDTDYMEIGYVQPGYVE